MKRMMWELRRSWRPFGRIGAVGVAVLLLAAAAWPLAIEPLAEERDKLDAELQDLRRQYRLAKTKPAARPATRSEQLGSFYAALPQTESLPDWLGHLAQAATAANIVLEKGEYTLSSDPGGRITRYQIDLPVRSDYGQLRAFLTQVLHEIPSSSLDDVTIRRDAIGNDVLDTRVRLTLYMRGSGP